MVDRVKLTDALAVSMRPGYAWDKLVPGFYARKQAFLASWGCVYKLGTKQVFHTISKASLMGVEEARDLARGILRDAANGVDPKAPKRVELKTVADLCNEYIQACEEGRILVHGKLKTKSTIAGNQLNIRKHIIPLLGDKPLTELKKRDIQDFQIAVASGKTESFAHGRIYKGGKSAAARSVALLSAVFNYGMDAELVSTNPAHRVQKFSCGSRMRIPMMSDSDSD